MSKFILFITVIFINSLAQASQPSRCEQVVFAASMERVAAVLKQAGTVSNKITVEASKQILIFSWPELEAWLVELRINVGDAPLQTRSEILKFDVNCKQVDNRPWPQ